MRGGQILEQRGGDAGVGAGRTPADPYALCVQPLHRLRGHIRLRRDGLRRQQRERGRFNIAFEPPERRIRRPKRKRRAGRAIGLPRRPRRQHAVDFRRQFRPVQPVKHQRQQREAARAQAVALPINAVDIREIHVSGDGQGVKQIGFDFVLRRALEFSFQVVQAVLQDIRPDAPAKSVRLSQQAHGVRRHEQIALRRHARPIPAAVRVLTLLNIVQQRLEAQPRLSQHAHIFRAFRIAERVQQRDRLMNRGRRRLSARTGAILRQIEQRAVKRRVQPNRHLPRNVAAPRRKGDFDGLIVPRRAAFRRRVFDAPRLHRRDALNPILKCPGGCRQFERERRLRVRDLRQIK